jgi:alpha/beta hydrolase family protein
LQIARIVVASSLMFASILAAQTSAPRPAVPNPVVSAQISGGERGQPFGGFTDATRPSGYLEEERFFSGKATAYAKSGSWGTNGRWTAVPSSTADYKVRMLVRRPADPKRFNGVLLVEWLNVTANAEGAADYMQMAEEIVRSGYAWVGIGAQASGVNAPRTGLKAWDSTRYGSLVHPGDGYSYDIFSQGARALRHPAGVDPLGGLRVRQMIATGRSQSAFRLVTYINAVHPLVHLFDGYFVHSRGANAAGLAAEQLARDVESPIPPGAHIRDDIDVPVFDLQTEGDMLTLGAHLARQEPNPHYRRWEIAGAAHAETPRWVIDSPAALDQGPGCKLPVNAAPHHAVVKAALVALTKWVREGVAPPQSPAIELSAPTALDPAVARDTFGNARGGIRLPELEAPTATLDGRRNDVANPAPGVQNFCFLYGTTQIFDAPALAGLYPTHDAFVKKFSAAADSLVRAGYWLRPEANQAKAAADRAAIGTK